MVICIHGIGYGESIGELTKTLMYSSYLRFGVVGTVNALYENRANLQCDDIFCPYADPNLFLRHLGMAGNSFYFQLFGLIFYTFLFRITGFIILKFKMTSEFSGRILNYASKILNH